MQLMRTGVEANPIGNYFEFGEWWFEEVLQRHQKGEVPVVITTFRVSGAGYVVV